MTNKFFETFRRDSELTKLLAQIKKASVTLDSHKSKLIARTIAFAYEQKDNGLLNSAPDFFKEEGVTGIEKPYAYACEIILKQFITQFSIGNRVAYSAQWGDHKAVCDTLKEHDIVKEFKEASKAASAQKREDKPVELIESYGPDNHAESARSRIDAALKKLVKSSEKDHDVLKSAAGSRIDENLKPKALAYLTAEAGELQALRELSDFVFNHKLTFRDVLNKMQELNA